MVQNTVESIKLFGKKFNIVSEAEQRDRNNTLYLFARVINKVVYVKFGEAFDQSIWDRYNGTGCSQHNEMIYVWKSVVRDTPIHKILKSQFKWAGKADQNPLHSKEVYIMRSAKEIADFIKAVSDIVKQKKVGPDFYRSRCGESALVPRTYQANVINSVVSILSKLNRVLLNISTRAGKSYISLKICKELGAKNILILTPFPKAEDSFRKLGERNMEFSGYKYIHLKAKTDKTELCDKNIIFCSYQFYDNDKQAVKDILSSMHFDVVILDECHNTSDSARTANVILNNLKYNKLVYMSGTPFNDIYSGYFSKDEAVTFDFIDFIKYAKEHPDEISLPKLYVKTIDNTLILQSKMSSLDKDIFSKADTFDYRVIFSNELHAESFFKWLLQPIETLDCVLNKPRWFDLNKQKHIIAFFNTNKEVEIAKKAIDRVWPFGDKTVIQISGVAADKEFRDTDEKKINELFDSHERALILTCGKLTTGVTLPKLDTVWYFKNTSSAEQFIQILFRTMTPCEGKDEVSMYCFDTEATLKVVREYAAIRQDLNSTAVTRDEDNDTVKHIIEDILSCFNFMCLNDKLEFELETVDSYFAKVHKLPFNHSIVGTITNYHAFDSVTDLGTEEINEKDLIVVKPKNEAIRGNCDRNNAIRKLLSRSSKDSNSADQSDVSEKVKRQIEKILVNMDKWIFVYSKIKTYKDLESLWPINVSKFKSNFIQLLSDNKTRINQMIEDIRYIETHNRKDFLMGLSFSNSTDMKTPDSLLENMFSKLSNVKGVICDPCCGCGSMLEYAHNKYRIPKKYLYGIELESINVKVCRKLGYKNVIQGDASDPKTWETLIDLLNRNTNKMKFDHIIMNPPYSRNLHLKILNEAICYSDDIVNLSPIRWLQDPLAEYKKNSDWKKFEDIKNKIESLEVIPIEYAKNAFNIDLASAIGIYRLSEKGGFDFNSIVDSTFCKVLAKSKRLAMNFDQDMKDGWRVRISLISGGRLGGGRRKCKFAKQKLLVFYDGMRDGRPWYTHYMRNQYTKTTDTITTSIKFATESEANNWINIQNSKLGIWFYDKSAINQGVRKENFIWLQDYTHEWTDEMLYKHFNLTEDEIALIEKEMA